MIVKRFFNHAVAGTFGHGLRSKYEMGFGLSLGLLGGLLFQELTWLAWGCIAFAVCWTAFYLAAFWVALREESQKGDRDYDKRGKYKLSREYWTTESATAARKRKAKADR